VPDESLRTLRIKPTHPSQGAWVIINESDFDSSTMELYMDEAEAPKQLKPRTTLKDKDHANR